jgi:glycosyltransferase involved in cell wall biosynthesis
LAFNNPSPGLPRAERVRQFRGGLSHDIILFANADWDHCVCTNSQHMADTFALRGFRVLYVESLGLRRPTAGARDLKRMGRRLIRGLRGVRRVSDNVWVYSPLVLPFHGFQAARAINQWLIDHSMRFSKRRLQFTRPIVWTYNPMINSLREQVDASVLVYHCVDDLGAVPGVPKDTVRVAEESMASEADAIFVTSRELYKRLSPLSPGKTHCMTNVADFAHFSKARRPGPIPGDLASIPRPRIGFIGTLSGYKLDVDLIVEVVNREPHWHWVFVGPLGTGESASLLKELEKPNVHLMGLRDYLTLPDYLRGMDVTVIPCKLNEYTRSMFPMKFFEYLAAGKPVVTTPLDALVEYSEVCEVADSPEDFLEAIRCILASARPDEGAGIRVAKEHTWETRLDAMLGVLEKTSLTRVPHR